MPDKICVTCGMSKDSVAGFHVAKGNKDGRSKECKECRAVYLKVWHKKNRARTTARVQERRAADPDRFRSYTMKYKYGITSDDYNIMLAAQNGVCAICGKAEMRKDRVSQTRRTDTLALVVDHDHATGKVRGLLCHKCNIVIAFIGEDPEMMPKILAYLAKHRI